MYSGYISEYSGEEHSSEEHSGEEHSGEEHSDKAGVNIYFENGVSWRGQNIQYSFPVNHRPSKLAPIGLFTGAVTKGILRII